MFNEHCVTTGTKQASEYDCLGRLLCSDLGSDLSDRCLCWATFVTRKFKSESVVQINSKKSVLQNEDRRMVPVPPMVVAGSRKHSLRLQRSRGAALKKMM